MRLLHIASALVAALTLGCGSKEDEHAGHEHGTPAEKAGAPAPGAATEDPFAALGAEDAALARAQKTCPVSDEELGSMGTPIKVEVKGRTVFLCCKGCKNKLLANPDTYLAKLDKAK
jgi:Cu(I)/Ag(I) efflux system membrane fusion protein